MGRLPWRVTSERLLILLYLLLFVPLFRPEVGVSDPTGYYSWARSLLLDGDLALSNEFSHYGMSQSAPLTPTGYLHNQWAAGSAWIWLPLMALVHGLLLAGGSALLDVAADGYSWPYVWAASFTTTLTGLAALLILFRLARQLFCDRAALLATLGIWLATPLLFYQYHQPLLAHANDALLNAGVVWLWWRARQLDFSPRSLFWLGVVIGAAVWVRTQNGILLIAASVDCCAEPLMQFLRGRGGIDWPQLIRRMVALLAGFALLGLPLMLFWRVIYGAWIVNTYAASEGGELLWWAPHWLDVLISSDRGLWTWAPITVLSLLGLRWLFVTDARLARLLGLIALLQWYVISSWSYWSGGHAFGPRFWIALTPFWVLTLAALVAQANRTARWVGQSLAVLIVALIGWNILLMLQYSIGLVAPTGEVDLRVLVTNQFTVLPELFGRVWERIQQLVPALTNVSSG